MKFVYGYIIVVFFVASSMQSTPFEKCKDGPPPKEVRLAGCTSTPCKLLKGSTVSAEWDFTVKDATTILKPRIRAIAMGTATDFPFSQSDGCTALKDSKCPLRAGQDVTYKLDLPIPRAVPGIGLNIEFSFFNDKNIVEVCFKLPAKISDK